MEKTHTHLQQTRAARPLTFTYPAALPVSARKEEIAAAIKANQVVIIAGETGSGKTTQIPKICMELGRGTTGMIGHTQPRRIAARSVASRIAEELGEKLGQTVGYQVRFNSEVSPSTRVKVMTDGILLAEVQNDPLLRTYDTLIIDEAHERSLNIDFLLGIIHRILPERPDLKLIITSATIDTQRFAEHFASHSQPAPIIEVSGRTYPVEIRYRPLVREVIHEDKRRGHAGEISIREEAIEQAAGIAEACEELMKESVHVSGPRDILVFLSGEGEIHDAMQALEESLGPRYVKAGETSHVPEAVEVLPLFARLTMGEQQRIFEPHRLRRIILSTNIAETSLTVPGIRYVVDPGTARISRFSQKTKVQRLPIEPVSQASANQRAGRCGRLADGVCIRLYSQEDFEARPAFTQPEIQRTSLASVILQMLSLGLGDIATFPFIDAPQESAVRAGMQLLEEIGAVHSADRYGTAHSPRLTKIGWGLARLPIDPRLGRMLLEAEKLGCANEMIVLVAALSVQDVRDRPSEFQAQADSLHARFNNSRSDFLSYLALWSYLHTLARELSSSQFRKTARAEFIHYLRYREWCDVAGQLSQMAKQIGIKTRSLPLPSRSDIHAAQEEITGQAPLGAHPLSAPIAYACTHGGKLFVRKSDEIHQSLLVGLLSSIGNYSEKTRDYAGPRGAHFTIWPGSGLYKKTHAWVCAAELVETSRLFARTVARIEPDWIEKAGSHLLKHTYSEAYWSAKNAAAMCKERVTIYGLTLAAERPRLLASVPVAGAKEEARRLFIRHGLVEGEWRTHHRFLVRNREALEKAHEVEERMRTHGLVASEEAREDFFASRIPTHISGGRSFDAWWKRERQKNPHLLDYTDDFLLPPSARSLDNAEAFPTHWEQNGISLELAYAFSPGTYEDGITVKVPITLLSQLEDDGFDWLVPGMREELVQSTIRALPKPIRRHLVPAPNVAAQMYEPLEALRKQGMSFRDAFTQVCRERGVDIFPQVWESVHLPHHLSIRFRVYSERGAVLDEGEDLMRLRADLAPASSQAVEKVVKNAVAFALEEARASLSGRASLTPSHGEQADSSLSDAHSSLFAQNNVHDDGAADTPVLETWPANTSSQSSSTDIESDDDKESGRIPEKIEVIGAHGVPVLAYPALTILRHSAHHQASSRHSAHATSRTHTSPAREFGWQPVILDVGAEEAQQLHRHREGVIHLLARSVELPELRVTSRWNSQLALALAASPYPSTSALVGDIQLAAARNCAYEWARENIPLAHVRDHSTWERLVKDVRIKHEDEVFRLCRVLEQVLPAYSEAAQAVKKPSQIALLACASDIRTHISQLIYPGFIAQTPPDVLPELTRYVKACMIRWQKAQENPSHDDSLAWQIGQVAEKIEAAQAAFAHEPFNPRRAQALTQARWMLEELRVQFFAQTLGTRGKVSAKRIEKLLVQ